MLKSRRERFPDDFDRRALAKLPLEERRAILKAQADAAADAYNQCIDHEWLAANLVDE